MKGHLDRLEDILRAVPSDRPLRWVFTASRDMPPDWEHAIAAQMDIVQAWAKFRPVVAHGRARGGDMVVDRLARRRYFSVQQFKVTDAEWLAWGGYAGHQRNARMLATVQPDLLTALIFRDSRGATGCRDSALARGIPCITLDSDEVRLPRVSGVW